MKLPDKITPALLNALSVEDRAKTVSQLFPKLDAWAAHCISYFRWNRRTLVGTTALNNASCFFLDFSERLFLVTAAHVYDGYLEAKQKSGKGNIICHIDNILFDPEARIRGYNRGLDIATFEFSYDDLIQMRKQAIATSPWPPPEPIETNAAFFGGFPGISRLWLRRNAVSFGLYLAHTPITTVTDRQITCRFDRDAWVPIEGRRIPPLGSDLGGLSGGPVLLPLGTEEGVWHYCLGGVISQAQTSADFETIVAVRAHFINPDGTISRI
jgi:hypothetical protein